MATETVNDPATVLTHPAFDRPPVDNQRRPGPKKGTLSMAKARRRRAYVDMVAAEEARIRALTLPAVRATGAKETTQTNDAASPEPAVARTAPRLPHEEAVIAAALAILDARLRVPGGLVESPQALKCLLRLRLAELEHEVFGVLFLDAQHAVIAFEILFTGTLTQTSVHPREIVKRALTLNAAAVVLAHNHPSGVTEPSRADELLTMAVRAALQMVEVRVIDHVIVGRGVELSFAERGLI